MFTKSALTLSVLALSAVTAQAATEATAWTDLNLRAGPGPMYEIIGVIPANAAVSVEGCTEGGSQWCRVTVDGTTGWAAGNYLTATFDSNVVPLTEADATVVGTVTYEDEGDAVVAGGASGAIAGAVVGGPVGAIVGAAIGAGAGGVAEAITPDERIITYVRETPAEPVYLEGEVVVGAGIPDPVALQPVPESTFSYAYVNGVPVLVENDTRRIVYIVR
ncbi:MAG: DUF1236 domain-containing protein [Pseudomonadota bacterium]|jgi:uncharacterized protein YraI